MRIEHILLSMLLMTSIVFANDVNEKILFAAARGQIDSLEIFLARDSVDMSYRWENGYSALDYAIERDFKDAFIKIVEYYSVNDSGNDLEDGLILSVLKNDASLVAQGLNDGANPNIRHISGYFPLSLAARWGSEEVVKLLLDAGADPNSINMNRYKTTPLIENARNGDPEIAKLLLSYHSEIDLVDVNNDPAINWATYYNQIEMVRLLVKEGANPKIRGRDSGDDAHAIAKRMGHLEIEQILTEK